MQAKSIALKTLSVIKYIVVAFLALLVIASVTLYFIDLNDYKADISQFVKEKAGYDVVINGDVEARVLPFLFLSIEDAALSGHMEHPDVSFKELRVGINILPLLHNEIEVNEFALNDAVITLKEPENPYTAQSKSKIEEKNGDKSYSETAVSLPKIESLEVTNTKIKLLNGSEVHIDQIEVNMGWFDHIELDANVQYDDMPIEVEAELTLDDLDHFTIDEFELVYNDISVDGELKVRRSKKKELYEGDIHIAELNLLKLKAPTPQNSVNKLSKPNGDITWNDEPDPLSASDLHRFLSKADIDIELDIEKLMSGDKSLGHFKGHVLSKKDKATLNIDPLSLTLAGNPILGRFSVDSSVVNTARYVLKLGAKDFSYGTLIKQLTGSEIVSGEFDLKIDLTGKAKDIDHTLLETINGDISIIAGEGRLGTRVLDTMFGDTLGALLPSPLRATKDYSVLNCSVIRLPFQKGVSKTQSILLDTQKVTISGAGTIDLPQQNINILLKPQPKERSLLSLATNLRLSGPLSNISIRPDAADVVKKAGSFVLGGLVPVGYVVPFMSGGGDKNPCITAIETVKRGEPLPQQKTKNVLDAPVNILKDTLEGGAKGLIKNLPFGN